MMKLYFLSPLFLQKLIWIPTRLIFRAAIHLDVRGLEHLHDVTGPVIFACNHSSELDPILIPASLPFWSRFSPIFYTSRESKFYRNSGWRQHVYGGLFFKIWGSYPVSTGLHDYERSLRHHIAIVRDGGSICIFPEGRITIDGNIQPARGGVAYLAERTRCTIVPVGISHAWHISSSDFIRARRKVIVNFGRPIYQAEFREKIVSKSQPGTHIYKEEAAYVMNEVAQLLIS